MDTKSLKPCLLCNKEAKFTITHLKAHQAGHAIIELKCPECAMKFDGYSDNTEGRLAIEHYVADQWSRFMEAR